MRTIVLPIITAAALVVTGVVAVDVQRAQPDTQTQVFARLKPPPCIRGMFGCSGKIKNPPCVPGLFCGRS